MNLVSRANLPHPDQLMWQDKLSNGSTSFSSKKERNNAVIMKPRSTPTSTHTNKGKPQRNPPAKAHKLFDLLDADKSGSLSRVEVVNGVARMITSL